jgi:hypothetical protein
MLCTVIRDIYKQDEVEKLAEAIEDITSPIDSSGWASTGIYCFWNPQTNEVLYFGLAIDLSARFKQHNGLQNCASDGCKLEYINDWFQNNSELGFSILVQSTLSQPMTSRNQKEYVPSLFLEMFPEMFDPCGAVRFTEGLLIGSEKIANEQLPEWNKIGGSKEGALKATIEHNKLAQLFTLAKTDYFVAIKSIRQISDNATFESYELHLHGVRQVMAVEDISFIEAWKKTPDSLFAKDRILLDKYVPHLNVSDVN